MHCTDKRGPAEIVRAARVMHGQSLGFRVEGLGFRVLDLGLRVQGLGNQKEQTVPRQGGWFDVGIQGISGLPGA